MQECAPRMQYWKGTIVEGVAKCWVALWDAKKADEGMYAFCCHKCSNADLTKDSRVRETKRRSEGCLCRVIRGGTLCARGKLLGFSSVFNPVESVQDYVRLLRLDPSIFEELVGDLPSLENKVDISGKVEIKDSDRISSEPAPTDVRNRC